MKRIKLLPSILMLVLCVGVLAMGIYAIKPAQNKISGTINISAGSASLEISAFVNGVEQTLPNSGRTINGVTWDLLDDNALDFDAAYATSASEVIPKYLRLNIKNLTGEELGAYFYNGTKLGPDGYATYGNLMHNAEIKDGEDNVIASAEFSSYTYIAPNDGADGGYDEVDMYITIKAQMLDLEELTGSFEYFLRVENYSPNVTTADYVSNTYELVKFSSKVGSDARTSISVQNDSTAKSIVIPTTVTSFATDTLLNCTALEYLVIPRSVTSLGSGCLYGCNALKSISTPRMGTTVNGFPSFYALFGKSTDAVNAIENTTKYLIKNSMGDSVYFYCYVPAITTIYYTETGNCYDTYLKFVFGYGPFDYTELWDSDLVYPSLKTFIYSGDLLTHHIIDAGMGVDVFVSETTRLGLDNGTFGGSRPKANTLVVACGLEDDARWTGETFTANAIEFTNLEKFPAELYLTISSKYIRFAKRVESSIKFDIHCDILVFDEVSAFTTITVSTAIIIKSTAPLEPGTGLFYNSGTADVIVEPGSEGNVGYMGVDDNVDFYLNDSQTPITPSDNMIALRRDSAQRNVYSRTRQV